MSWASIAKGSYLTFDRRTLGLTRILLGFYLIMDLFRRTPDWEDMFGDIGVLPTWLVLDRPQASNFSLLHGFTSGPELWVLWAAILTTYVLLLAGYKTKIWQVLSLLFVTSMNGRVLLIENGGYVVQNLLLLWTAFLPLGDRFSLDSLLGSLRRRRERSAEELCDRSEMTEPFRLTPFVSIVGLAICLQLSAIYYFNVVHKTGPNWHNGTAVHYVLYNDRMATPIVAAVRTHVPFWAIKVMTPLVLAAEGALPFLLLLPRLMVFGLDTKLWMKRLAVVLICTLHIGFGSSFVLGPFAWALCIFSTLLFGYDDWELAKAAMKKPVRERTVIFDASNGFLLFLSRILARLDHFQLLGFDAPRSDAERTQGLSVLRPDGTIVTGHRAVADVVGALPLGPVFAWLALVPGISHAVESVLRRASNVSRITGLDVSAEPAPLLPDAQGRARSAFGFARTGLREAFCALMLASAVNQALVELWSTKKPWNQLITSVNATGAAQATGVKLSQQPELFQILSHKLRFLQGWFMFSPNPVMDDGTIVVDAVTADGRHINPFLQASPDFDLVHAESLRYNQIWSDYFNRMHFAGNRGYQDAMVAYMRRLPDRTGNPDDRLVYGEVYWVSDMSPKWGQRESWGERRDLLFSFEETGSAKDSRSAKTTAQ
ncbi:MAG: hypothetical protein HOV80_18245 [Polyangiaceae bacterium]|nr:hypothetical protein [Polyangiaceae bacterium]